MFVLCSLSCVCKTRRKIQAIIQSGDGVADEHCPDDPESVQFWVNRKAKLDETNSMRVSGEMTMHGRPSGEFIDGLTSLGAAGAVGPMQPVSVVPPAASGTPRVDETLSLAERLQSGSAPGYLAQCDFTLRVPFGSG